MDTLSLQKTVPAFVPQTLHRQFSVAAEYHDGGNGIAGKYSVSYILLDGGCCLECATFHNF